MCKKQKLCILTLCVGIILSGIGTGVAFLEFSSLTYQGKMQIGTQGERTATLDYEYDFTQGEMLNVRRYGQRMITDRDITVSEAIPEDTVRFVITYNADFVEPYLQTDGNEEYPMVWLGYNYIADDVEVAMRYKDQFLEHFRNREIMLPDTDYLKEVNILINPASRELIRGD